MNQQKPTAAGFLTFTLHAHLPYVVNHGTWPHGMEWLHEAAAETYLPLLRVLSNLDRDGIAMHCNLNLSPILLEQLAHPLFKAEFPRYLERKIVSAGEDESFFSSTNEPLYAELARFWHRFFSEALDHFRALDSDIIRGFRHFHQKGVIDIITCGATHGYMPLLGTDESVRAQIRTAVQTHQRHIGKPPRGMWAPECGYRPAGTWSYPIGGEDGTSLAPIDRIGVEQALAESDIEFFFVDTHLIEESASVASPYERNAPPPAQSPSGIEGRTLYQPYLVDGPYTGLDRSLATTVFPRDPRTGVQVWSGDYGYPGDAAYLDFHKKRWPGGHRYWRVTGSQVDMADKALYDPAAASARVRSHAEHFVHLVWDALHPSFGRAGTHPSSARPLTPSSSATGGLEGPQWLEAVVRILHDYPNRIHLISCADFMDRFPPAATIAMHEGSWGAEGTNHVWMNQETSWTYACIYPAELFVRDVCSTDAWRQSPLAGRIVRQLCRELLLLESSRLAVPHHHRRRP